MTITQKNIPDRGDSTAQVQPAVETATRPVGLGRSEQEGGGRRKPEMTEMRDMTEGLCFLSA